MFLLAVQHRLFHLDDKDIMDFIVAVRMFTRNLIIKKRAEDLQLVVESYQKKLNITAPQKTFTRIEFKELYTPSGDPVRIVYEYLDKQRRVMQANELYKLSDGTLQAVRDEFHHRILDFRLGYNKQMPLRKWTATDKKRSELMVEMIDKLMLERRIIRNLERLVHIKQEMQSQVHNHMLILNQHIQRRHESSNPYVNGSQVLYETRHHASRSYSSSNYRPLHHQQVNESSLFSFISTKGLNEFRERWTKNRHPHKLSKWISMFVSPSGEHVAIAVGNEITILQRDDNYQEPCGIFTSSFPVTFMFGAWSEEHGVLGVFDSTDTLYFIRANGEEITRIIKQHLKVPLPIISFVIHDDKDKKKSCLCTFSILASDGSVHDIEISQDPSASISTMSSSDSDSLLQKQFPQNVCCCGYYADSSLLAVVSSAVSITSTSNVSIGPYSISLWQWCRESGLQQLASAEFEGLYAKTKGYLDQVSFPKVLFSPAGKFVATLDLRGCLVIYKLSEERLLTVAYLKDKIDLSNIIDFTWWTDRILVIASRSGKITMIDIDSGVKVLENDFQYSLPILERVPQLSGCIFILESRSSESNIASSDLILFEPVTLEKHKQFESAKLQWSLLSFSKKSVQELYDILISSQQFDAAFKLADHHGLDKDDVLKAQWLHSLHGTSEIKTLLSNVKDQDFVLFECLDRIGPTEDAMRALLAYGLQITDRYIFSEGEDEEGSATWDFRLARLKLLQFRDRLETFIGINMGRFSAQDYRKFRSLPIKEAATALAESGKIGALNLLFKRHPYSVSPCMLEVLAAIPETVPVQTYGQLLPGCSSPQVSALREVDWVERESMVNYIKTLPEIHESGVQIRTEPIVKQLTGYIWPSTDELSNWYKCRARDMDTLSGQLDNCLSLIEFACRKGIKELQEFHELISYLHQLIYSDFDDHDMNFSMSLITWEQLSDYEKFKLMLKGINEENVIKRLQDRALPFMHKKLVSVPLPPGDEVVDTAHSFLVRWMKEVAMENKIEVCLIVIEEGCKEFGGSSYFRNEAEAVDCALQCLYLVTATDKWSTMASILSKLPYLHGYAVEGLKKHLKLAEGHVEAGRLLTLYQVPKPITFFLEAQSDSKSVKQILRLILSKFIRRQPGRTDNDWANMWRDFQSLQEKAFPFVDLEYMLMEFCRGLLKAGKFSLARNYLKGSGSVVLPTEKAENIIILAAREYFFSASSLSCSEIWKAKECLNILPSSRNVMIESDIIDALTVKLPRLGVNILPMQFKQIKDPMEIIKLAITSQVGAYLNVNELIEIAKLLGLNSQDEISSVQEAIAREAAVAGDLQLAFDLCLIMAKKGHGPVWDLCTALARGPALENMDINSRKQLLGFALSHCDKDSIGELLHAWKDLDMIRQCEKLSTLTGEDVPDLSGHDIVDLIDSSGQVNATLYEDQKDYFTTIKTTLSDIADFLSAEKASDYDSLLKENGKLLTFVALRLPWLIELSQEAENGKKFVSGMSIGTQAMATVLSWLARNDFSPKDSYISSLAKSIMVPPVTDEEDILGCSFLLNLNDASKGVQLIEEQLKSRKDYNEKCSMMNLGMIYSLLHYSSAECDGPAQRRELLLRKFQEKYTSLSSDERNKFDQAQSSFWREWKLKLEEQKRVADHTRAIEQIIPGIETTRFLSGDITYMESVVFSFIESVKTEKKRILKDVMKLASDYGLDQTKVLLKFLSSTLLSEIWTNDDIKSEISQFEYKILDCAEDIFKTISLSVYPEIDGRNKERLAYIYNLLSSCFSRVEEKKRLLNAISADQSNLSIVELDSFYKIMEQECSKLSFMENLNVKNIAGLHGPNLACVTNEIYANVNEKSVEALAEMVKTLAGIFKDGVPEGLVPWPYVYGYYISNSLTALENSAKSEVHFQTPENLQLFINELELTYDRCKKYIRLIAYPGASVMGIMKKFFKITPSLKDNFDNLSLNSKWKDDLVMLINFWLRLIDDLQKFVSSDDLEGKFSPTCVLICLEAFVELVNEETILTSEGWASIFAYINFGLVGDSYTEILNFCRSMIFSGCRFKAIGYVYHAAISHFSPHANLSSEVQRHYDNIVDLPHLYIRILETILKDIASGSREHQHLYRVLSSLSELDGDLEVLNKVRSTVWDRMVRFSDNMEIPSHARVHMLELMQFITDSSTTSTLFSSELQVNVLPWDGWDNTGNINPNRETGADNEDAPNRFTHTLIALKSSQLLSNISPNLEITPNDLSTLDSAVSCFFKLSEYAVSRAHVDVLMSVLQEWEGGFATKGVKEDMKTPEETPTVANDWGNDDWDEGWENFQEEESVEKETETKHDDNTPTVHVLRECWAVIFKKLASLSQFSDMLKIIDQSVQKGNGVLLDEDASRDLSRLLLKVDCFITLKIALLLPYENIHLECLGAVEEKLKLGNIPNSVLTDHELFISLLSSGLVSTIITKPSYGNIFTYLNYMVGSFTRNCQEAHFSRLKNGSGNEKDIWFVFKTVLLPCYLSELVKANQVMLAGLVVTKIMHTANSLGLINVAEASLRKYLENQLEIIQGDESIFKEMKFCEPLVNTVAGLNSRLESLIKAALDIVSPNNVKR
nr:MAG2-interacting protein 2 [Tanacetum cinerariifolium]